MAYYRCMNGVGSPRSIIMATSTSAQTVSLTGNTHGTLYLYISANSSTASYREANTQITSSTGCTYEQIDFSESGINVAFRLYRLKNCQSSLSVTCASTQSINKNVIIFAVDNISDNNWVASGFDNLDITPSSSTTHTYSNLQVGDVLLIAIWGASSSKMAYNTFDGATCTGGIIEQIGRHGNSGTAYCPCTFYSVKCQSTSVTISHTTAYVNAFKVTKS